MHQNGTAKERAGAEGTARRRHAGLCAGRSPVLSKVIVQHDNLVAPPLCIAPPSTLLVTKAL